MSWQSGSPCALILCYSAIRSLHTNIDKMEAFAPKPSSLLENNNHKGEGGGVGDAQRGGGVWWAHSWPSLQLLSWLLPGFSASWLGSSLRMSAALLSENSSPLGSRPSGQGSFRSSSLSWAVCLCRENTRTHTLIICMCTHRRTQTDRQTDRHRSTKALFFLLLNH